MPYLRVLLLLMLPLVAAADSLVAVPEFGLRVQSGFRVTRFADHDLAPDIQCLTLDGKGRVVVSGPGYIKTLFDDNNDGQADRAVLFAETEEGAMGLCFAGTAAYVVADGGVFQFEDGDLDGQADAAPERLFQVGAGEHGAHALRRGPDGFFYFIVGNDAGINPTFAAAPSSLVRVPEAGAWVRFPPDFNTSEILAHGFRNPCDFDFHWTGGAFTYDSDAERDVLLPWYTPARLYDIALGGHHGWRLPGYERSWNRPDYYGDTVSMLAPMGRGSPTGMTSYRHTQFPEYFRDGLFFCDWTFGRVFFASLDPDDAGYTANSEVFLEPLGVHGFAPTGIAVAPDGSLLVSSGGRGTRGAVYRIEYIGPRAARPAPGITLLTQPQTLEVLEAPQPLEAWSRENWVPAALQLGADPFVQAAIDTRLAFRLRVRAIEICTELFGGLPPPRARFLLDSPVPEIRARLAWSLGHQTLPQSLGWLVPLLGDANAFVRRNALEAVAEHLPAMEGPDIFRALISSLAHEDKRVRLAAALAASRLSEGGWQSLGRMLQNPTPGLNAMVLMAAMWRHPEQVLHPELLEPLANVLAITDSPDVQREAIRLMILALGDWNLQHPSVEVFTGYELPAPVAGPDETLRRLRPLVRRFAAGGNTVLAAEAMRLLAMLEDDDAVTAHAILLGITYDSAQDADFHRLACLARLRVRTTTPAELQRLAGSLIAFDRKLGGLGEQPKQNWSARLSELVQALLRHDTGLAEALIRHPMFGRPGQVEFSLLFTAAQRTAAARRFLPVAQREPNLAWPPSLIELLGTLPAAETASVFSRLWSNATLRDALLLRLATQPNAADRPKFLTGLASPNPAVATASVAALRALPRDGGPTNLLATLRLLRRLLSDPPAGALRSNVLALLETNTLQRFDVREPAEPDAVSLTAAYAPVLAWVREKEPLVQRRLDADLGGDPERWLTALKKATWDKGNPAHGEQLFAARGCAGCHAGPTSLGPDLSGAAQRMSAEDLVLNTAFPSRDVAPAYRATRVVMRDGTVYLGHVVFTSADGVLLRLNATTTVRLAQSQIASREPSDLSLMPTGLLDGLSLADLADLNAYLKTLASVVR